MLYMLYIYVIISYISDCIVKNEHIYAYSKNKYSSIIFTYNDVCFFSIMILASITIDITY